MTGTSSSVPVVVVMGVSGTGKSTIGLAMAGRYGFTFLDADDFHPPENVERSCATREPTALACSALKESYRQRLRDGCPDLLFAFLDGTRPVIAERLGNRTGHYMPAALLDSQFETLEPPGPGPHVLVLDCRHPLAELSSGIAARLQLRPG